MDKTELSKYITLFEDTYPNPSKVFETFIPSQDTDDDLLKMLINSTETYVKNGTTSLGALSLGYAENCGALQSGSRILRIQMQSGYSHKYYWQNKNSESWFLGETEFDWEYMLLPVLNTLQRSLDPTYPKSTIIVSAPFISDSMEYPDWEQIFEKIISKPTTVIICDAGIELVKDKAFIGRNYIVYPVGDSVTISAYDMPTSGNVQFVGCLCFAGDNKIANMKNIQHEVIDVNILSIDYDVELTEESSFSWEPIESLLKKTSGLKNFLEKNSAFFGKEYYALADNFDFNDCNDLEKSIYNTIKEHGTQCAEEICEKIFEREADNIALNDLVTVALTLTKNNLFNKTTLMTKRKQVLSSMDIAIHKKTLDSIEAIPSNYYDAEWKLKNPSGFIGSYHKLNANRVRFDMLVSVIVEHFTNPTTYAVAEELLAFYNFKGDPSAYFTAKVFFYLSGNKRFLQLSKRN